MRDPIAYSEPEVFCPDRFVRNGKPNPAVRDPYNFVFGFGRRYPAIHRFSSNLCPHEMIDHRMCPGRHFGDSSLFITIALVLHVFSITPPLDELGHEIKVEPRTTDSFVS